MYDFIDKTSVSPGTALNRVAMLAIQGFQAATTTIDNNGVITQVSDNNQRLVTYKDINGRIIQEFYGEKSIRKITSISGNTITTTLEAII